MKLLVAATPASTPACRGKTRPTALANTEAVSLTKATVVAPRAVERDERHRQ
jgi:hypothetical protein